jgi:allophanate hydrolase subunit 1
MRSGRPVASIDGWQLPGATPIPEFDDPDSAVRSVLDRIRP